MLDAAGERQTVERRAYVKPSGIEGMRVLQDDDELVRNHLEALRPALVPGMLSPYTVMSAHSNDPWNAAQLVAQRLSGVII